MNRVELRPANPVTELVVKLAIYGDHADRIALSLGQFDDEFRKLAKQLHYKWNGDAYHWWRRIDKFNGPLTDRLIEAACKLLGSGFIVSIPDESLQARIITRDFAIERTRWITHRTISPYKDYFTIHWPREDDYYQAAKRIRGARYCKPDVIVPSNSFDEVLDFADRFRFSISDGALALAEQAKQHRQQQIRVELQPRAVTLPVLPVPVITGEIADEFRDTD